MSIIALQVGCERLVSHGGLREVAILYYDALLVKGNYEATYERECGVIKEHISKNEYVTDLEKSAGRDWVKRYVLRKSLQDNKNMTSIDDGAVFNAVKVNSVSVDSITEEGRGAAVDYSVIYLLPQGKRERLNFWSNWFFEEGKWCHIESGPNGWDL